MRSSSAHFLGSVLVALGGALLVASGFLPLGHHRTHWVVFGEALDSLMHPDPDLPFSWRRPVFYGAEVLGLSYPALAGLAFAVAARGRSRAAGAAMFLLHITVCLSLAAASVVLATPEADGARSDPRATAALLGGAVLFGALLSLEVLLLRKSAGRLRPDRVNFAPALFLLGVNATLFFFFWRSPHWPVTAYWVGSAGSALTVSGIVLRRGRKD